MFQKMLATMRLKFFRPSHAKEVAPEVGIGVRPPIPTSLCRTNSYARRIGSIRNFAALSRNDCLLISDRHG